MNAYSTLLLGLMFGILSVTVWTSVPNVFSSVLVLLVMLFNRKRFPHFFIGLGMGVIISVLCVSIYYNKVRTAESVGTNLNIEGEVRSLSIEKFNKKRVIFDVDTIDGKKLGLFSTFRVQVYFSQFHPVKEGERWLLQLRLRPPHGRANQAGFDAELYFLANHIHAKGKVLFSERQSAQITWRQTAVDMLAPVFDFYSHGRYLLAMSFGERIGLTQDDWLLLKQTGLAHLMAISGLHIGLAYGLSFLLFSRLRPLLLKNEMGLTLPFVGALVIAILYAWSAGFSISTQRALVSLSLFVGVTLCGYRLSGFHLLLLVAVCVLIFDPFSAFSVGFYLSFGAVLAILLFHSLFRFMRKSRDKKFSFFDKVKQIAGFQVFLCFSLLPLTLLFFDGFSVTGIVANLICIPIVSLITVPAVLFGLLVSFFEPENICWWIANASLSLVESIAFHFSRGWIVMPFPETIAIAYFLLIACYFWFRAPRPIFTSIGIFFIGLSWKGEQQSEQNWQIDVLDVGHGLAVLITKDQQSILYDTGSAWGKSSMAKSVIAPLLVKNGWQLEGVIVSHFDQDHAGGLPWVIKKLQPTWIRSPKKQVGHLPCQAGERWQWKGLTMTALSPNVSSLDPRNPFSCVVRVSDGNHSVLLTGDIGYRQERKLVRQHAPLASDIILVPHHGSRFSSSPEFIEAVNASVAIVSSGRYTPWVLPHPEVIKRYQDHEIQWFNTAKHGQVNVMFSEKGWKIARFRQELSPFWYRDQIGAMPLWE